MEMLPFLKKYRLTYLRFTPLVIVLVLLFASLQIFLFLPTYRPTYFIIPAILGTLIGLLLSSLIAIRKEILDRQRIFHAATDLAQEFIYVCRADGVYEYVSPSCVDITGYQTQDFYDQPHLMNDLILNEDRPLWDKHVHQMSKHGKPETLLVRIKRHDGEIRWLEHVCSDVRDERGQILGVRSTNLDVTERIEKEKQLTIAATAFETNEAIIITDSDTRIIRVNKAFSQISGYEPEEVIGKTPAMLKSGKHDQAFYQAMWQSIQQEGYWEGELQDRRKNGEIYPKHLTITSVKNANGEVINYVGVFGDISVRKAAEEEINRLAYYDTLTQLPNRRLLVDRMQQAMAQGERNHSYGAVLFIDLDNFKELNDTHGHDLGDKLLIEVGQRLLACVRTGDTVARLGGDEFVLMLANLFDTDLDVVPRVESVAIKVLDSLLQPYLLDGHQYCGSASIGVALFNGTKQSIDELLKHSDVALYQAKNSGRGTLRFFNPSMQQALESRARIKNELRNALQEKEFVLNFQPQVDSAGNCIGAEVLLRWQHPTRGLIQPNDFIPFAEEFGLIGIIDLWVLRQACKQVRLWSTVPRLNEIPLAVNISAEAFMRPDFVNEVLSTLRETEVASGLIKLELTETSLIHNMDEAISKISRLKAEGVRFSLDDFGTGYSSLSYLRQLPIYQLKIDRAFVLDVVTEQGHAVIAKTIIGMANNLGLDVVAEGVEEQSQLELLTSFGCQHFQGYLFARPLPLVEFERFLKKNRKGL